MSGPAEIIKDSFSPFCFCSGSFFARTTSPLESVFIFIGFLYRFKVQIIGAVFITDTPPGKIPSFSSLIIFCNGITICIIIIIFINSVENRSTQGITVGIDPWFRIGQLIIFTMPCSAKFPVKIYFITGSAEIGISQFENTMPSESEYPAPTVTIPVFCSITSISTDTLWSPSVPGRSFIFTSSKYPKL